VNEDAARDRLAEEHERLTVARSEYQRDHLTTESGTDSGSEFPADAQPQADLSTEPFNRERGLSILEDIDAELSDVEHALRRLDDGSYGTCEACGRPISGDRLEAMPAARFCVDDQALAQRETYRG
jgi:RNA polymerase-binding transcription factor DksA